MTEFFKATTLITLALSAWHIVLLVRFRQGAVSQAFAGFLMALMVPLAYNYSRLTSDSSPLILEAISHSMLLFYGPCLYIILHMAIKRPIRFRAGHFLPFALVILLKITYQGEGLSVFLLTGFVAHTISYGLLNMQLIIRYRRHFMVVFQQFSKTSGYWLSLLAVGIALISLADIALLCVYVSGLPVPFLAWQGVLLGFSSYILLISFLTLKSLPHLLVTRAPSPQTVGQHIEERMEETPSKVIERQCELSDTAATQLADELHQLMHKAELFRQNTLSLDDLASALGVNKHKVSELLNVHLEMSFYEYLNQLRINYACTQLRNPAYNHSIIELAYEAGFNNKNSFYRVFKQKTEQTPSAFRRAQKEYATA